MIDHFLGFSKIDSQGDRWEAITPADTNLAERPKALFVAASGNAVLLGSDGASATFPVTVGQWLPLRPTQVSAATTATLIGIY